MEPKDFHAIGKRDACAEIMMLVRDKGERGALRTLATTLLASDLEHPNPHAKWYLANHPNETPQSS